jgi:hypothetical protein
VLPLALGWGLHLPHAGQGLPNDGEGP